MSIIIWCVLFSVDSSIFECVCVTLEELDESLVH